MKKFIPLFIPYYFFTKKSSKVCILTCFLEHLERLNGTKSSLEGITWWNVTENFISTSGAVKKGNYSGWKRILQPDSMVVIALEEIWYLKMIDLKWLWDERPKIAQRKRGSFQYYLRFDFGILFFSSWIAVLHRRGSHRDHSVQREWRIPDMLHQIQWQ